MDTDRKVVGVVVAHPDEETLWAGGLLIDHPSWDVFVACLCRKGEQGQPEKFSKAIDFLGARGKMADMDDGPEQHPLPTKLVQQTTLQVLPHKWFDLIITHSPDGEYTRYRRNEEVGKAVIKLWSSGKIRAKELWTFAYEDGNRRCFPKSITDNAVNYQLRVGTWRKKYSVITEVYGCDADSWEAKTAPREEIFRHVVHPKEALMQLDALKKELR